MILKRLKPAPLSHRVLIPFVFQMVGLLLLTSLGGCIHQNHSAGYKGIDPGINIGSPVKSSAATLNRHCPKPAGVEPDERAPARTHETTPAASCDAGQLTLPYPVKIVRPQPGLRASTAHSVRRCPAQTLRYCDHRTNRCACVSASAASLELQPAPGRF